MSELVAMRQRIKAIETIKKVTHAMRLISMSGHSRLRAKRVLIEEYKKQVNIIISRIQHFYASWSHPILWPKNDQTNPLIIIVGSQKGLCGNFNINLFSFVQKEITQINQQKLQVITVGKKAVDYGIEQYDSVIMHFKEFMANTVTGIARTISDHIWYAQKPYSSVIIFYNFPKTFFAQIPQAFPLIPFTLKQTNHNALLSEEYIWEQEPMILLDALGHKLLHSRLHRDIRDIYGQQYNRVW